MTDGIGVFITGDREIAQKFDEFPQQVRGQLRAVIAEKIEELAGRERALVPVKTGRLRSQIRSRVIEKPEAIIGQVYFDGAKGSQDFAKAGALEYGGSGKSFKVRGHEAQLGHVFGRAAQLRVQIAAHTRVLNISAKRFVRDPVEAMKADIEAALAGAVEQASGEFNR
jgi:hypothetical protein